MWEPYTRNKKWNTKTKVIPVRTGATGTIETLFGKYLINVPGKYTFKELQETALMGTSGSTNVKNLYHGK
jgi:hypothetical protein